jgi:hypothetical protein
VRPRLASLRLSHPGAARHAGPSDRGAQMRVTAVDDWV